MMRNWFRLRKRTISCLHKIDALAQILERMLKMDEKGYQRMCYAARKDYEERFTPEKNYGQLLRIYEEIKL